MREYTGTPGRGDLIRLLLEGKCLDQGAELMGYERQEKGDGPSEDDAKKGTSAISRGIDSSSSFMQEEEKSGREEKRISARFLHVTRYTPKEPKYTEAPGWFTEARPFRPGEFSGGAQNKVPPIPLAPWSRLWPMLKKILGQRSDSPRLDTAKAVDMAARGETLEKLPYKKRNTWAPAAHILIDRSLKRGFFWSEETRLMDKILRLRGRGGVKIFEAEKGPLGEWTTPDRPGALNWQQILPETGAPLLLLGTPSEQWKALGCIIKRVTGRSPVSLAAGEGRAPWKHCSPEKKRPLSGEEKEKETRRLLMFLSLSLWTEPPLLRELRLNFTSGGGELEQAVLDHPHTQSSSMGLVIREEFRPDYWRQLSKEETDKEKNEEKQKLLKLLEKHHAASPVLLALEMGLYGSLTGKIPEKFKAFMARASRTQEDSSYQEPGALKGWIKSLIPCLPPGIWKDSDQAAAALLLAVREELEKEGTTNLPPEVNPADYPWLFQRTARERTLLVRQEGPGLRFEPPGQGDFNLRAPIYQLNLETPGLQIETLEQNLTRIPEKQPYLEIGELATLKTPAYEIEIAPMEKPPWASAIGRDNFGLWVEFTLKEVTSRLRWINPGEFLMGSPEGEPERADDEYQHKVILTQGFWLAETACTQELWEAVMGENPSNFKGPKKPVETVSWDDVKGFIQKLNALAEGLDLRLPTEAQWEYTCRAGTTTPFSFGENITPQQVNYDGNSPYNKGRKGTYREETVEVKSLPPNLWGLYEMHGNVWEWCEDWFGEDYYKNSPEKNPLGLETGDYRVVRGGGWIDLASGCRSAFRNGYDPDGRSYGTGFRLSLGHEEKDEG